MFKKDDKPEAEGKLIDIETGIQGNVKFNGPINLRINGHFEGELEAKKGTLIIGEKADVKAKTIKGENINILGKVRGDIICTRLELSKSARVIGNIEVSTLVVGEGAALKGKCQMPISDEKSEHKESASKKKAEKKPEETKKEGI